MAVSKRLMGLAFLALAAPYGHAHSEIYKCPDGSGRPTYTNVKRDTLGKNCTLVSREVSVVPALPARAAPSPGADSASSRNESRRRILESELQSEQQQLVDARQKLAEQEAVRSGNERNYARVEDRLKPFQEAVDQHQKNIDQLKSELSRIK